jgi:epidermal growth factor receptor substrate 15
VLEGYAPPAAQAAPVPRQPSQIATIAPLPPLTPQDRQKFLSLFNTTGPVAGYLGGQYIIYHYSRYLLWAIGEEARELFIRSKLPVEWLNAIWYASHDLEYL